MINVENLTVGYSANQLILNNINLSIEAEKITTIIGSNGCGKSTLIKTLSRCIKTKTGTIALNGKNIQAYKNKNLAKEMAILPQTANLPSDIIVYDLVATGRFPHLDWRGKLTLKDKEIIEWAIRATNIEPFTHRMVSTLSGGERQRVLLAMALCQKPKILFLDEPTTHLDISHQFEVLELVQKLNKELGITVVMVLHDLNQSIRYSDTIVVINNGKVYAKGNAKTIIDEQLCEDVFGIGVKFVNDTEDDIPLVVPVKSKSKTKYR